ncbi:MAG: DMT family transporter [Pseudomonadota bacterium]
MRTSVGSAIGAAVTLGAQVRHVGQQFVEAQTPSTRRLGDDASKETDAQERRAAVATRIKWFGVACAVGTAFFLSGNNTALAVYYADGGSVPAMMAMRYAFYCVVVGLVCQSAGHSLRLAAGEPVQTIIVGIVFAGALLALLTSYTLIPVPLAVLTLSTFPILTTLINAVLERTWPGAVFTACLAVALIGLAVALEVGALPHDPLGIACAGLAAVGMAVTFVLSDRWFAHMPPSVASFHISMPGLVITTLIYCGYLLVANTGGGREFVVGLPTFGSPGSYAILLSLAYYTIAILLMFRAIQMIGGPSTSMVMNLEPIFTLAMVIIFLSAPFKLVHLIGALIVVAAVVLAQFVRQASQRG